MTDYIITEIPIAPLKNIDTDEQFYPITHVDAVEGLEGYGGTVTEINKLEGIIMTSTDGTVSLDSIETEGNIGIETTHIDNSVCKLGGIKPGKYFNAADAVWNDTNAIATHGITESSDTDITISSATSTAGRFYPLQVDKNGVGFVNVPWVEGEGGQTSDFTLRLATNSTIWLQKELSDYSSVTIPTFDGTSIGLVPYDSSIASADRNKYHLAADGTWVLPIDSKVSQTLSSTNAEYPILLSTVSTSGDYDGAYYSTTTINASTGAMTVTNGNNRTIFNSGFGDNPVTVQSRADALSNWSTVSNQIITTSGLVPAPTSGYFLRYTTADGFNWASVSGTDLNTTYKLTLNNNINGDGVNGVDLGTLFAPETGTTTTTGATAANQLLLSNSAITAPTWTNFTFPTGSGNTRLLKYVVGTGWTLDSTTYLTTLPSATTSAIGGIKVGSVLSSASGASSTDTDATKRYSVLIDSNDLGYVNIPWSDTTYSNFTGATSSTAGANGLVPAPAAGDELKFLSGGANWLSLGEYNGSTSAKSVINIKNGNTTSTSIPVYMAATTAGSTSTPSSWSTGSDETSFPEVLFYRGLGINFSRIINGQRNGLRIAVNNASDSEIGGIKVASTPALSAGTVYSGTGTYYPIQVAPDANQSACVACVKVPNTTPYSLPVATQSTLGGLIVLADKDAATGYQNNKDIIAIPIFKGAIESKTTIIDGGEEITSNVEECHYVNVYDVLYTIEKDKDLRNEFKRVLDIS